MDINKPFIKLSPSELENILVNEKKKWRIFRLQQVRAQAREEALRIREEAEKEETNLKAIIKRKIENKSSKQKFENVHFLEGEYEKSLREIGAAHKQAVAEINAIDAQNVIKVDNDKIAVKRGNEALLSLKQKKIESKENEMKSKLNKQLVLEKEKQRALKVSQMATPPNLKSQKKLPVKPVKKVMFHEAGTLTTSSYIPSSMKIVKEQERNVIDARKAAEQENKSLEHREAINKLKASEDNKKIKEREKIARTKQRTKEMYSQLMKELEEAEQNHQLSHFLEATEESTDDFDTGSGLASDMKSVNRMWKLEQKVEKILREEPKKAENIQFQVEGRLSSHKGVLNIASTQGDTRFVERSRENELCGDVADRSHSVAAKSLFDSNEIHFKETVPVHSLPIIREKFRVKVPYETSPRTTSQPPLQASPQTSPQPSPQPSLQTSRQPSPQTSRQPSPQTLRQPSPQMSRKPSPQRPSQRPSDVSPQTSSITSGGASTSESSFEEIRLRIEVENASSDDFSMDGKRMPSFGREKEIPFLKYDSLKEKLDTFQAKNGVATRTNLSDSSSCSSSATEYMRIPDFVPTAGSNDDTAWKNIKHIQESRKKIESIIKKLQEKPIISTPHFSEKQFQTFKTPPRIYTENIKPDGDGERPMTKRHKFEEQKKFLLEHYARRLVKMKEDELKHISTSTVSSSGIDMSSRAYLDDLKNKIMNSPNQAVPVKSLIRDENILNYKFSDTDTIPTKIPATNSTQSAVDSFQTTTDSPISSNSTPSSSTPCHEDVNYEDLSHDFKREICHRLLYLQQLKQKLIILQQNALCHVNNEDGRMGNDASVKSTDRNPTVTALESKVKLCEDESSLDLSVPLSSCETSSREDSTPSRSDYSLPAEHHHRECETHFTNELQIPTRSISTSNSPDQIAGPQISPYRDERDCSLPARKGLSKSALVDGSPCSDGRSPSGPDSQMGKESSSRLAVSGSDSLASDPRPRSSGSDRHSEKAKSSSAASIPNMTHILQNFGLDWAFGMIKKMDNAEKDQSTDSSKL